MDLWITLPLRPSLRAQNNIPTKVRTFRISAQMEVFFFLVTLRFPCTILNARECTFSPYPRPPALTLTLIPSNYSSRADFHHGAFFPDFLKWVLLSYQPNQTYHFPLTCPLVVVIISGSHISPPSPQIPLSSLSRPSRHAATSSPLFQFCDVFCVVRE